MVQSLLLQYLLPPGEVVQVLEGDGGLVVELQPGEAAQGDIQLSLVADTVQVMLRVHAQFYSASGDYFYYSKKIVGGRIHIKCYIAIYLHKTAF